MNRIVAMVFITLFLTLTLWCTSALFTSKAIHAQEDFSCTNVSEISLIECEALVAIRTINPEADTDIFDGWWTTNTPCSWARVVCEDGYIIELVLIKPAYYGYISLGLTTLPPEIRNFTRLTSLHLENHSFGGNLPSEIGDLGNLTSLYLGYNGLSSVPPEIGNLVALRNFELMNNQLTSIPSEMANLTNLTSLRLDGNDLASVPPELSELTNLTSLRLNSNDLAGVPSELGDLTNLTSLRLNGNDFTSVPSTFSNLGPEVLAQLADDGIQIVGVNLDCAAVSQIPQAECEALVAIRNANPDALFTGGWAITEEPCSWEYVTCSDGHVSELRLYFDIITSLPPEIGNLTHLTVLDLDTHPEWWVCRVDYCEFPDHNKVTTLPSEIGNLTSLVTLDLGGNKLTNLPPEIGNLINLQVLDLRYNDLATLPPAIGNLINLQTLDLSSNDLTTLPPAIGNLINLQALDLNSNDLTTLPPAIGNLVNLTSLALYTNPLTSLPPEMYNIPALEDFYSVDLSLIGKGGTAITPDETSSSEEGIFLPFVAR